MRIWLKRVAGLFLIPWTRWYLRKERSYTYGETSIVVHPGVFHPGLFPSTPMLLECMKDQDLKDVQFLEMGCGSGLISIVAARNGARVTACDISENALRNARLNAEVNKVDIQFIQSDVWDNLPPTSFDWVVVNPPYYRGNPGDEASMAWYAGLNLEFFEKFFAGLNLHIHEHSKVLMSLTLQSEIQAILQIANRHQLDIAVRSEKTSWLDGKDYVFDIVRLQ